MIEINTPTIRGGAPSEKIDDLLYEREIVSIMKVAEKSLSEFFEEELDIYRIEYLKVRYKFRQRCGSEK
ncbi:MAG: hypothetical protein WAV32_01025 [Halobacteriota archaeon]